jgi:glycosyltransferase involved in cell wall biosynthesis
LAGRAPRFTIISAAYGVAPYLEAFIGSIERQTFDLGAVEVIAVDDGATDGSGAILDAWAQRRPELVRVVHQENSGLAAAQNRGLDLARGQWVTFADPDDELDPDYLAAIDRFLRRHPGVDVVSGRSLLLREAEGRVADRHPRRYQFAAGTRVADLAHEPNVFPYNTNMAFFPLPTLNAARMRVDHRVRPHFEDGHFTARYLLGLPAPRVGLVREARYLYRVRAAGTSMLQTAHANPRNYDDVLRFGYLDLLEQARAQRGHIPEWLQHVVIYELSWYLSDDEPATSRVRIPKESVDTFHELLSKILALLDPEVVERHRVRPLRSIWVDILGHAARPVDWHSPFAVRTKVDRVMRLRRIAHRYTGAEALVEYVIDGRAVEPAFAKTIAHRYYHRTLMRERVAWLPLDGRLEVYLNRRRVEVRIGWPERDTQTAPMSIGERLWMYPRQGAGYFAEVARRRARDIAGLFRGPLLRLIARSGPVRAQYGGAWVVLDRTYEADDNAERLYEYLRAERPDIRARFVLAPGTRDWARMSNAGVKGLVPFGSWRWRLLMLNAAWIVSSQADIITVDPPEMRGYWRRRRPRFAFLQHGIIKDDLSRWLNARDIDLFVVSTPAELASVAGDDTGYEVTSKETRLTGLPRFDRLRRLAAGTPVDQRDLVLIAPTWRKWLTVEKVFADRPRDLAPGILDSEYIRSWMAILRAPEIAAAAARHGRRVAFMPHPNMQPLVPLLDLPPAIETPTFADDVQRLYARSALLVTDYSSVFFNAACIDVPIVYFQFDRDSMMGGSHLGRQGYFDYERDGYGPVTYAAEDAIREIVAAIERGPRPAPEFQARIDAAFTTRDGHACERVVAAIEELSRPYPTPASRKARTP